MTKRIRYIFVSKVHNSMIGNGIKLTNVNLCICSGPLQSGTTTKKADDLLLIVSVSCCIGGWWTFCGSLSCACLIRCTAAGSGISDKAKNRPDMTWQSLNRRMTSYAPIYCRAGGFLGNRFPRIDCQRFIGTAELIAIKSLLRLRLCIISRLPFQFSPLLINNPRKNIRMAYSMKLQ